MPPNQEAEGGPVGDLPKIGRRCFVGNLAWSTSWQDLKDHFRDAGTVVYCNVTREPSGRSKGWGIVEFEKPEEAISAVSMFNGTEFAGRTLIVREDREDRDLQEPGTFRPRAPRSGDTSKSSGLQVVVQNLPWSLTSQELHEMFAPCGPIVSAEVVAGRDGRSKGYGTVRFETADAAESAIARFNDKEVEQRRIVVRMDRFA